MSQQGSAHVFGANGFDVTYALEGPGRLSRILGPGPELRAALRLVTPSARVRLLGGELSFSANLDASVVVHERGWRSDAFEQAPFTGAAGTGRVADLRLEAALTTNTETNPTRAPWSLTLGASGRSRLLFRHLFLVAEDRTGGNAFRDAIERGRWPFSLSLDGLADGELHALSGELGLDFGLTLSRGFERDVTWTLLEMFEDAPVTLKTHLEGLAKAAVGAGLQEELALEVGRIGTVNPGWVRIRLRRRHESTLTFGASLALQVHYDLGSSLAAFLDRALDLMPLATLMRSLQELARALASGGDDWQKEVSALVARRIGELVEDEGWLDHYTSDPVVGRLVDRLVKAAQAWEQLDDTVTSFWEHFLSSATAGRTDKIRAVLATIAAIDPEYFDASELLTDGRQRQVVELVETLSGRSLEELLAGSRAELQEALGQARRLAQEALRVLDLDEEVLAKLHAFAGRTGIEACVTWISAHATSVKKLKTLATSTIESLVGRLLGKTLAEVDAEDLGRLRRWAVKVSAWLDRRQAWEEALRHEMERLKGDLGYSVGIEVGRLLRQTAVIDLEVDPTAEGVRRAVEQALAAVDVRRLLEALPEESPEPVAAPSAPRFMLRECAFASRRERWATGSWLHGSLTGESGRRHVVESTLRVAQSPPPGPGAPWGFTRKAILAGGFVRGVRGSAAVKYEAGVWLDLTATGPGNHLDASFTRVTRALRLAVLRHDLASSTSQREPSAIVRLLADLGFTAIDADARGLPDLDGQETSLAINISLPQDAIEALVAAAADESAWSTVYLNAGYRWLEPGLEENEAIDPRSNRGAICRALMSDPGFQANWRRWADLGRWAPTLPAVRKVEGRPISPRKPFKQGRWQTDFIPLGGMIGAAGGPGVDGLISWRPWSFARLQRFAEAAPTTCLPPDELVTACDRFAALIAAAPGVWEEPLFGLWLVLAFLARHTPEALTAATGLATLRWRPRKDDPWLDPAVWRLPESGLQVPSDPGRRHIFPL
ncbi:MAG TPA: hypothetical protein PLS53_03670 [Thermoanaerobaculaceae bacterium]|nr:hypothetical protein [Thermoanaerobaculaceae bacterium]HPS77235.1 hypothetical protein [Thermoanaerobaculaceae bacterium]